MKSIIILVLNIYGILILPFVLDFIIRLTCSIIDEVKQEQEWLRKYSDRKIDRFNKSN